MSDDTWRTMWVTHGKPCVNMHGTFENYIRAFTHGVSNAVCGGSGKEKEEEGKREREERRREREERKGEREEKKRKGKKKREEKKKEKEERERKEEKEGVLCSEQTRTAKNPKLRYKR